jgi:hypothetical protein
VQDIHAPTLDYRPGMAVEPESAIRLLPANLTDPEPRSKRLLFLATALAITWGYFYFITSYWMPAHPGVDQNGYLVGGKQMALSGSSGFRPANPFLYVGAMWVMTGEPDKNDVWYYPKYPIGLPLLNAIPLWIDWDTGKHWALYISPASTALALLGMFLLVRTVAGSFVGTMAMLLLGMNVVTLSLANNPNSHAPALGFVVWGMFMLLRWWQTGSTWRGIIAGLLLGYSVTVRYLDGGLLLLPLLVAVLCVLPYRLAARVGWVRAILCMLVAAGATWLRLRVDNVQLGLIAAAAGLLTVALITPWWRFQLSPRSGALWRGVFAVALVVGVVLLKVPANLRDDYTRIALLIVDVAFAGAVLFIYSPAPWRRAAVPLLAWGVPVLWLVGFNWFAMGTITGYDTTNESTGFTWDEFWTKWEFMVQQLHDYGAFFVLPLSVIGLALMWRWNWRVALAMLLWLVPASIFYAAYYWGMDLMGMSYLRFFLTLIPAMILPALWLLRHGGWARATQSNPARGSVGMPIACGVLVAICAALGLRNALPSLERDLVVSGNLFFTCEGIASIAPKGSVVFTDQRGGSAGVLNFLQWRGDYDLYAADAFNTGGGRWAGGGGRFGGAGADAPNPRQGARRAYLRQYVYATLSDSDLIAEQKKIVRDALNEPDTRRVFVIVPGAAASNFRQRFLSGTEFQMTMLTRWTEPLSLPPEPVQYRLMPTVRGFGSGRGPQSWQVFEIVRGSQSAEAPSDAAATEGRRGRRNFRRND